MNKILLASFFLLSFNGCKKSSENCTNVVVTLSAPSCSKIGVIIKGTKYTTNNMPSQYDVEGKHICIKYSYWDDPAVCPCCGGKKVHIIAVY
jgi:hypothetical protein